MPAHRRDQRDDYQDMTQFAEHAAIVVMLQESVKRSTLAAAKLCPSAPPFSFRAPRR